MRALALAACKACDYDMAAVDILVGEDDKLYILELNACPALKDDNTLAAYVKAIKEHYQ